MDPLIGESSGNARSPLAFSYREVTRDEGEVKTTLYSKGRDTDWSSVVKLLGGEYFFAPSISFLKGLVDDLWT